MHDCRDNWSIDLVALMIAGHMTYGSAAGATFVGRFTRKIMNEQRRRESYVQKVPL